MLSSYLVLEKVHLKLPLHRLSLIELDVYLHQILQRLMKLKKNEDFQSLPYHPQAS